MSEIIESRTTQDRFYITAKVVVKKFSYREHQSRGKEWNEMAEAVVLIPEQTTECDLFFSVWLPERFTKEELEKTPGLKDYSEVMMECGLPINGYFRGALCNSNHLNDRPHIFVMTKSAEEKLRPLNGKKIKLTILGEQEEEKLYEAKAETRSPYADLP